MIGFLFLGLSRGLAALAQDQEYRPPKSGGSNKGDGIARGRRLCDHRGGAGATGVADAFIRPSFLMVLVLSARHVRRRCFEVFFYKK
jgi:hypothetical protein